MSSKQSTKENNKIVITSQEIARFRSELAAYPQALKALDEIEDCEGNIENSSTRLRKFRLCRREFDSPEISIGRNFKHYFTSY